MNVRATKRSWCGRFGTHRFPAPKTRSRLFVAAVVGRSGSNAVVQKTVDRVLRVSRQHAFGPFLTH
jgi:hypothetical protein